MKKPNIPTAKAETRLQKFAGTLTILILALMAYGYFSGNSAYTEGQFIKNMVTVGAVGFGASWLLGNFGEAVKMLFSLMCKGGEFLYSAMWIPGESKSAQFMHPLKLARIAVYIAMVGAGFYVAYYGAMALYGHWRYADTVIGGMASMANAFAKAGGEAVPIPEYLNGAYWFAGLAVAYALLTLVISKAKGWRMPSIGGNDDRFNRP